MMASKTVGSELFGLFDGFYGKSSKSMEFHEKASNHGFMTSNSKLRTQIDLVQMTSNLEFRGF